MKKIFAIGAASLCCAAPAVAGPYVNVEAKSSSLVLTIARLFFTTLGWASKIGDAKFYAQAGPALCNSWTMVIKPLSWLARLVSNSK